MRLDEEWLRDEIRRMSVRSKLYRLLKEELTARGNWKNRPRGNPQKGAEAAKFAGDRNG